MRYYLSHTRSKRLFCNRYVCIRLLRSAWYCVSALTYSFTRSRLLGDVWRSPQARGAFRNVRCYPYRETHHKLEQLTNPVVENPAFEAHTKITQYSMRRSRIRKSNVALGVGMQTVCSLPWGSSVPAGHSGGQLARTTALVLASTSSVIYVKNGGGLEAFHVRTPCYGKGCAFKRKPVSLTGLLN